MTEKTQALLGAMEQMECLESLCALNTLIAGGLVTDPTVIRETAEMSGLMLLMQLEGMKLLLNPENAEAAQKTFDLYIKE